MGMGWGKVTAEEWKVAKDSGFGSDDVPDGDYVVELLAYRSIDPGKNANGIGTHFLVSTVTADPNNPPEVAGKNLEQKFGYHPNPASVGGKKAEGYAQMNAISLQNAVKTIEATAVEPLTDSTGLLDIEGTLKGLPGFKPQILLHAFKKKGDDGITRQETDKPRPTI